MRELGLSQNKIKILWNLLHNTDFKLDQLPKTFGALMKVRQNLRVNEADEHYLP
jgi:hypothetical protein